MSKLQVREQSAMCRELGGWLLSGGGSFPAAHLQAAGGGDLCDAGTHLARTHHPKQGGQPPRHGSSEGGLQEGRTAEGWAAAAGGGGGGGVQRAQHRMA